MGAAAVIIEGAIIEEHYDPQRTPTNLELLEEARALCASVGRPEPSRTGAEPVAGRDRGAHPSRRRIWP